MISASRAHTILLWYSSHCEMHFLVGVTVCSVSAQTTNWMALWHYFINYDNKMPRLPHVLSFSTKTILTISHVFVLHFILIRLALISSWLDWFDQFVFIYRWLFDSLEKATYSSWFIKQVINIYVHICVCLNSYKILQWRNSPLVLLTTLRSFELSIQYLIIMNWKPYPCSSPD